MLLVLPITFHCHYYIWGCMYSPGPIFVLGDWKDISLAHVILIIKSEVSIWNIGIIFSVVVYLRCLLHHILSLIVYTFRENRDFVSIIIAQFMMSANSRIRVGLQIVSVYLYITPYHYHCANLSEDIELLKCLSDIYFVECVCTIEHIRSVVHYTIYGAGCFQFTHFSWDDWDNIYFVSLSSNWKYALLPIVGVKPWNNGMYCMSLYILITLTPPPPPPPPPLAAYFWQTEPI